MPTALPVIPWIGGKRRLAKHLLPLFPPHRCYVEPCCGAAALFFLKEPSPAEVLNDVHGDLVTLYRVLQHHPEEFLRQFRWALSSRQLFRWLQLNAGRDADGHPAGGPVLLSPAPGLRGPGLRPDLRHGHHLPAAAQPSAYRRGPVRGPPSASRGHHRAPGLGRVRPALRPPPRLLLRGSALLGGGGVRRPVRPRGVRENRRARAIDPGEDADLSERPPRHAEGLRRAGAGAGGDQVQCRAVRREQAPSGRASDPELVTVTKWPGPGRLTSFKGPTPPPCSDLR